MLFSKSRPCSIRLLELNKYSLVEREDDYGGRTDDSEADLEPGGVLTEDNVDSSTFLTLFADRASLALLLTPFLTIFLATTSFLTPFLTNFFEVCRSCKNTV